MRCIQRSISAGVSRFDLLLRWQLLTLLGLHPINAQYCSLQSARRNSADTTNTEAALTQQLHYPTIYKPQLQKNTNIRNWHLKSSSCGNWTRLLLFHWSSPRIITNMLNQSLTALSLPLRLSSQVQMADVLTPIALWENSWMTTPMYLMKRLITTNTSLYNVPSFLHSFQCTLMQPPSRYFVQRLYSGSLLTLGIVWDNP